MSGGLQVVSWNDRRLVAAYEDLRSQALEHWQRGPGLALMKTRGLRCWMEACGQLLDTPPSDISRLKDRPETGIPTDLRGEIVVLLASMLLHKAFRGMA